MKPCWMMVKCIYLCVPSFMPNAHLDARTNIDVIYTSHAYATMSVSVCLSVTEVHCGWCMPGRGEGLYHAMLATARPSCLNDMQ